MENEKQKYETGLEIWAFSVNLYYFCIYLGMEEGKCRPEA